MGKVFGTRVGFYIRSIQPDVRIHGSCVLRCHIDEAYNWEVAFLRLPPYAPVKYWGIFFGCDYPAAAVPYPLSAGGVLPSSVSCELSASASGFLHI